MTRVNFPFARNVGQTDHFTKGMRQFEGLVIYYSTVSRVKMAHIRSRICQFEELELQTFYQSVMKVTKKDTR